MSYFAENYKNIKFPIQNGETEGLRNCQVGAIHAIASHFTLSNNNAVIVMPTGSGKTEVIILAGYILRANRVLVVTSSKSVRNQIFKKFSDLKVLKKIGVFNSDIRLPVVKEVKSRMDSTEKWEELQTSNAVISTPYCVSPAIGQIPNPSEDLFDLIIFDEAHHAPAETWTEIAKAFPKAKKILFTATPFRLDRKEIKGDFIYTYTMEKAHKDGIFGKINFIPLKVRGNSNPDIEIAKAAQKVLATDKAKGLNHCLMVRTDGITRAKELFNIYRENTDLNIELIHSNVSQSTIDKTISKLNEGRLDGVICVGMLGEGFDFPNLKIAAIHSPHKSLSATLQFVGRFARTNAEKIKDAKFIAIPSDIRIEMEELYNEEAIWQELITSINDKKLNEEIKLRKVIRTLSRIDNNIYELDKDASLFALRPYNHVKIYKISGSVNLSEKYLKEAGGDNIFSWLSSEHNLNVTVIKHIDSPKWMAVKAFEQIKYDLIVTYYNYENSILFICSTIKTPTLYSMVVDKIVTGSYCEIAPDKLRKIYSNFEELSFFNIGMENRISSNSSETYRTYAGSASEKSINESDAYAYNCGHCTGRGMEDGVKALAGISKNSKIWRGTATNLNDFIDWCNKISAKLSDECEFDFNSNIKYLSFGEEAEVIPYGAIAADWNSKVYKNMPYFKFYNEDGSVIQDSVFLLDIEVGQTQEEPEEINIKLLNDKFNWSCEYSNKSMPFITSSYENLFVIEDDEERLMQDFLNDNPLRIFFSDFSCIEGNLLHKNNSKITYDKENLIVKSWQNVDIRKEFYKEGEPRNGLSIHGYIEEYLNSLESGFIICDHSSYEIADYIKIDKINNQINFEFYICKASSEVNPGDRVEDTYEICGQFIKTLKWLGHNNQILQHISRRTEVSSRFIRGNIQELTDLINETGLESSYNFVLVQPGFSKRRLTDNVLHNLAAAQAYSKIKKCSQFDIWVSD